MKKFLQMFCCVCFVTGCAQLTLKGQADLTAIKTWSNAYLVPILASAPADIALVTAAGLLSPDKAKAALDAATAAQSGLALINSLGSTGDPGQVQAATGAIVGLIQNVNKTIGDVSAAKAQLPVK